MVVFVTRGPDRPASRPQLIDMTLEGGFAPPPHRPLAGRIAGIALVVAVLAGLLAVAALMLYVAVLLIPLAIAAALVAYVALRWQAWRARSRSGVRGLFCP